MTTPAHHVHFSTSVDSTTPRVRPIHGYAPQVVLYVCGDGTEPADNARGRRTHPTAAPTSRLKGKRT